MASWDRPLQAKEHDGKWYLAEHDLIKFIGEKWWKEWAKVSKLQLNRHSVSLRVCPNSAEAERAFWYATKHLGKWSDITKVIHRVRNNNALRYDSSKLFANYWAYILNIRLCRTSRGLGKVERFQCKRVIGTADIQDAHNCKYFQKAKKFRFRSTIKA